MAEEIMKSAVVGAKTGRRDEFTTEELPGKWTAFKATFSCGMSKVLIASLFCILFCSPAIAWVVVFTSLFLSRVGSSFPYGIFDGLGYAGPGALTEGLNTANVLGAMRYYEYALIEFSVLVPCIAVGAIGLGGLVYVARLSMFGGTESRSIKVIRAFFTGVKYTWSRALVGGALVGASIFLMIFCAYVFDAYALGVGGKIVTMIFSIALIVLASIYAFYLVTIAANYTNPFGATLKDALVLTFVRMPANLLCAVFASLIIGLAFLFILLFGSSTFGTIIWFVLFFIGFYAVCGIFVAFDQSSFAKKINDGMAERESKARAEQSYAAIRAAKAAGERQTKSKPASTAKYVNPKKKKKQPESEKKPERTKKEAGGYSEAELKQMAEDKRRLIEEEKTKENVPTEDMSVYEDDE